MPLTNVPPSVPFHSRNHSRRFVSPRLLTSEAVVLTYLQPLDGNAVYTIASQFIVSCPASNMKLPFVAFPLLTATGAPATCEEPDCSAPSQFVKRGATYDATPPSAGTVVSFTAAGKVPAGSYLTFVNGLAVTSVSATIKGTSILERCLLSSMLTTPQARLSAPPSQIPSSVASPTFSSPAQTSAATSPTSLMMPSSSVVVLSRSIHRPRSSTTTSISRLLHGCVVFRSGKFQRRQLYLMHDRSGLKNFVVQLLTSIRV